MNKTYRYVWNRALGAWVATSELVCTRGRRGGCIAIAAALLASGAVAQTVNYANGDYDTTSRSVAVGNTLTLNNLDSGVAEQAGRVSGVGDVVKTGPGTLILSGLNTYSGGTTLNTGSLRINNAAVGSGALTINGGTLGTHSDAVVEVAAVINSSFGLDIGGPGIGGNPPSMTFAGSVILNATPTFNLATPSVLAFYGPISGNHGLVFDGSAAISLYVFSGTSSNTYTGTTTVQGNAILGLERTGGAISVPADLVIDGSGVVALQTSEQVASQATLTVNSSGQSGMQGFTFQGSALTQTVAALNGAGTIGLAGSTLRVGAGDFRGAISDGAFGSGGRLEKVDAGMLTLSGANIYTGATTVSGGTLRAGAANTFSAASAHRVAAGATLDLAGFNQTLASLANSGTVSLAGVTPGTMLTVNGPYVGNNGLLRLSTTLIGSSSVSDRLVLNGPGAAASGRTTLQITNLGGLGALTNGNGIEVVSALDGATTTAQTSRDAFALAGGHVDAGAYEYRLHAGDVDGAGENWYLRSTTAVTPTPASPMPSAGQLLYRREVPLFAALPMLLRQANLAMLGNLHQRVGDDDLAASGMPVDDTRGRHAWGRLIGADIDMTQRGVAGPHSNGRLKGLQVGTDLYADKSWRAGLYLGHLEGDIDVRGFARGIYNLAVGDNNLRSEYLGGYATRTSESGFYADLVLQTGRHRYAAQQLGSPSASSTGSSLLISIEAGQSLALNERWKLEPQLQLVHQHLNLSDTNISGAIVQQHAHKGWLARVGVRVKGELVTDAGALQPYARLNFYRASDGNDIARFVSLAGATGIASGIGGHWAEVAAGFSLGLNRAVTLYGEAGRLFGVGGSETKVRSGLQGSLGMRMRW